MTKKVWALLMKRYRDEITVKDVATRFFSDLFLSIFIILTVLIVKGLFL